MTYLEGFILGITQGLTEFIPVSSTGHLILVREWFNYSEVNGLAIDAVLQLATVLAILVYFWRDLWNLFLVVLKFISGKVVENESRQLLLAIIFGTIPALILGLLLQNYMETTFRSANFVAFG